MKVLVYNLAAEDGGGLFILKQFYQDACRRKDVDWTFIVSIELQETESVKVIRLDKGSWIGRLKFENLILPGMVKDLEPDLVISLQNMPIRGVKTRQFVYLHQSLQYCPKKFSFLKADERGTAIRQHLICGMYRRALPKADHIFVQTRWMKEATGKWIHWEGRNGDITVVPVSIGSGLQPIGPGKDRIQTCFYPVICESPPLLPHPPRKEEIRTFFYPARAEMYKNHEVVIEACRKLIQEGVRDFRVLFTIEADENAYSKKLKRKSKGLPIDFTGFVPYERMWELYNSTILLFPSYLETCGLPLLEARTAGARIIASDLPFAHEALDGYEHASFFPYDNPNELAKIMRQMLEGRQKYIPACDEKEAEKSSLADIMLSMAMKPKILFITNIPSPYRVDFFQELGKYCDLTVLFERSGSVERDPSWNKYRFDNFKGIILKGIPIGADKALCPGVVRHLRSFDHIICTDFLSPTGMLAIEHMRRNGIKYVLESDGGFAGTGTGIKERLKTHFIKGADRYFSTSGEHDRYYKRYGADEKQIIRYPFSSVRDSEVIKSPVSRTGKAELRKKLGIYERYMVLAVGQFIRRKGFDLLLEGNREFNSDVGFYFVGGELTEEYKNITDEKNIHYIGFKGKEELSAYYKAADVFVLPTREDIWGLVVNEAMANGLPVITTTKCLAGMEMVQDGVNGYLVKPEDVKSLTNRIKTILSDSALRERMSEEAITAARRYTIETMASKHIVELRKA